MTEGAGFVDAVERGLLISSEGDALDAVAICGEHDTQRLLLTESNLGHEFFELSNGLAGAVMQKWMNYAMRVAFVLIDPEPYGPRVVELAREHSRHPSLRFFTSRQSAVDWLVNLS